MCEVIKLSRPTEQGFPSRRDEGWNALRTHRLINARAKAKAERDADFGLAPLPKRVDDGLDVGLGGEVQAGADVGGRGLRVNDAEKAHTSA